MCRRRDSGLGVCRELREAVAWMIREKFKGHKPKNESTDAKNCGGTVCSSDEDFCNGNGAKKQCQTSFDYYPT